MNFENLKKLSIKYFHLNGDILESVKCSSDVISIYECYETKKNKIALFIGN